VRLSGAERNASREPNQAPAGAVGSARREPELCARRRRMQRPRRVPRTLRQSAPKVASRRRARTLRQQASNATPSQRARTVRLPGAEGNARATSLAPAGAECTRAPRAEPCASRSRMQRARGEPRTLRPRPPNATRALGAPSLAPAGVECNARAASRALRLAGAERNAGAASPEPCASSALARATSLAETLHITLRDR
jgi:hypothetical protein